MAWQYPCQRKLDFSLGERNALLMGASQRLVSVKSAFALLLTKVTKSRRMPGTSCKKKGDVK
jgi:hypothetical protein